MAKKITISTEQEEAINYAKTFLSLNCQDEKDALMLNYLESIELNDNAESEIEESKVNKAKDLLHKALFNWFNHKDCEKWIRDRYWYKVMGMQEILDTLNINREDDVSAMEGQRGYNTDSILEKLVDEENYFNQKADYYEDIGDISGMEIADAVANAYQNAIKIVKEGEK